MKVHQTIEDEIAYAQRMADIGNICLMEASLREAKKDPRYARQANELRDYGYTHAVEIHVDNAEKWARQVRLNMQLPDSREWLERNLDLAKAYAQIAGVDISKKIEEILASIEKITA